jgi:hypothetical protein
MLDRIDLFAAKHSISRLRLDSSVHPRVLYEDGHGAAGGYSSSCDTDQPRQRFPVPRMRFATARANRNGVRDRNAER